MKNTVIKNLIVGLCALLVVLCAVLVTVQSVPIAFAAELSYDDTDVMDDLRSSTVNGVPFDFNAYLSSDNSLSVINFVEYCYTSNSAYQGKYGLYIYLCNPAGLAWQDESAQNQIQMAVEYGRSESGEVSATRYAKFRLKFCSKSSDGKFYKYKIEDRMINGTKFINRVTASARRYDVSGIELLTKGQRNATEYGVGGTWTFTGYAEGLAPGGNNENTLNCMVANFETLELDVHHTYYRTNVSSLGANHYNEINTVYFSVPDNVYKKYGSLQKIRAEWWEYKTKPMIVSSNQDIVDMISQYTGYELSPTHATRPAESPVYNYLDFSVPFNIYSMDAMHTNLEDGKHVGYFSYNLDLRYLDLSSKKLGKHTFNYEKSTNILPYVFYSPVAKGTGLIDEVLDWFMSTALAGDVEASRVAEYIYNYSNQLGHGFVDCNGRQIYKDLFEDSVDDGRTMGYNDKEIDFGDTFDLKSYNSNHSWWDKLWDYGFSAPKTDGDVTVSPIYEMTEADFYLSNDELSKTLFVNSNDVSGLKAYYAAEKIKGNHVILFRFANTDYFTTETTVYTSRDIDTWQNTYMAQMTVFLDFDIIELTFAKEGVYHVIPVVGSPIDIINGVTAPPRTIDWLRVILVLLAVILGVVIIALLIYVLAPVIKVVFRIIAAPFKAISKAIKKRKAEKTAGNSQPDVKQNQTADKNGKNKNKKE